ncbi:formyltransferase family protein [Sediminitomix flava]|uniref:Formyl transferase-like protein n=1 Tax=Sediminitomix flava TaxID=379075 RepID=A0A315Z775_SEDFL|nr:formyltransferase family protein [Sediminitomix flava]PWJ38625.1 formyl transferase-like protein [Sediminitomix flava]
MNIVYGCSPSYVAVLALNLMLRKYKLPIKAVVFSKKDMKIDGVTINDLKGLRFMFKRFNSSFIFYYLGLAAFIPLAASILNIFRKEEDKLYSVQELSKMYGFKIIESDNFNKKETIDELKNLETDVFLSCGLDQILKKDFINMPKVSIVNIHPSLLPDFRGVEPFVHLMESDEEVYGSTLHELTADIDCGDILIQTPIKRGKKDSHLTIMYNFMHVAMKQFNEYFHKLDNKEAIIPIPQFKEPKYPYMSWPSIQTLDRLKEKGLEYTNWTEVRQYTRFTPNQKVHTIEESYA